MNYFKHQWNALKKSFRFPQVVFGLEFVQFIAILVLALVSLTLLGLVLKSALPLLNTLLSLRLEGLTDALVQDFAGKQGSLVWFVINTILISFVTFILFISLIASFQSSQIAKFRNKSFNKRTFYKLCVWYSITTIIYGLLGIFFMMSITTILGLTILLILLNLFYLYLMLIITISVNEHKSIKQTFKNIIKIHQTLPPIIISIVIAGILFLLFAFIALILKKYLQNKLSYQR